MLRLHLVIILGFVSVMSLNVLPLSVRAGGAGLSQGEADAASGLPDSSKVIALFSGRTPTQWGESVRGVKSKLKASDFVVALTLDACGSSRGNGYDATLIDILVREKIPATLFMSGLWIESHGELVRELARNPLFEIANHGDRHKPASVNGRKVYGISGTRSIAELVDEIEVNARRIADITGKRPRFYRSGTAYYDEVAVEVAHALGHDVAGYSVLGDAGATWPAEKVRHALEGVRGGDIVILHMNHPESGTAAGVRAALVEMKKRGVRFVQLSEAILE